MQYVITNSKNVSVIHNGEAYCVTPEHPNYNEVIKCIENEDEQSLSNYVLDEMYKQNFADGRLEYKAGMLYWEGIPLPDSLQDKIIELVKNGEELDAMSSFLCNLTLNPSDHSVFSLINFLRNRNLPVTKDGCFLAYKAVTNDYKDIYSNTIDNSIGQIVSFSRNKVNPNPNKHCSYGLHVGAIDYVCSYGMIDADNYDKNTKKNRIVIVKVNPRDVVTVPTDASFQKLRCCKYEVIADFNGILDQKTYGDTIYIKPEEKTKITQQLNLVSLKNRFIQIWKMFTGKTYE